MDYEEGSLYLKVNVHYPMIMQPSRAAKILDALGFSGEDEPNEKNDTVTPVLAARAPPVGDVSSTPCHIQ
jgi:hypothetical protein